MELLTAVVGALAGFGAGLVTERKFLAKRRESKSDSTPTESKVTDADAAEDVDRQDIIAHTVNLRDMAQSDIPEVQAAMQDIAKSYLIGNRRHFS